MGDANRERDPANRERDTGDGVTVGGPRRPHPPFRDAPDGALKAARRVSDPDSATITAVVPS